MRAGVFGRFCAVRGDGVRRVAGVLVDSFLHGVFEFYVESAREDELDFPVLDKEMSSGLVADLLHCVGKFAVLIAECASDGRQA